MPHAVHVLVCVLHPDLTAGARGSGHDAAEGGEGDGPEGAHWGAAAPGASPGAPSSAPCRASPAPSPASLPSPLPPTLARRLSRSGCGRKGLLGPTLPDLFFQDENLWGFPLDLQTYVYLGSWPSMAGEMLQLVRAAGPRGPRRSPRPVAPGTLPFNQWLGQGGEERAMALPSPPGTAHAQLLGPV